MPTIIMLETCQRSRDCGVISAHLMNITALPTMSMGLRPTESMIALHNLANEIEHFLIS